MQYGYIKVCAATPQIKVADVSYNTQNIIKAIKESAKKGSQLTVFPELSVCGYTCGDLFNQRVLLKAVENGLTEICKATEGIKTLVFVGAPLEKSGRLYNCAVVIWASFPRLAFPITANFTKNAIFASLCRTGTTWAKK